MQEREKFERIGMIKSALEYPFFLLFMHGKENELDTPRELHERKP